MRRQSRLFREETNFRVGLCEEVCQMMSKNSRLMIPTYRVFHPKVKVHFKVCCFVGCEYRFTSQFPKGQTIFEVNKWRKHRDTDVFACFLLVINEYICRNHLHRLGGIAIKIFCDSGFHLFVEIEKPGECMLRIKKNKGHFFDA